MIQLSVLSKASPCPLSDRSRLGDRSLILLKSLSSLSLLRSTPTGTWQGRTPLSAKSTASRAAVPREDPRATRVKGVWVILYGGPCINHLSLSKHSDSAGFHSGIHIRPATKTEISLGIYRTTLAVSSTVIQGVHGHDAVDCVLWRGTAK